MNPKEAFPNLPEKISGLGELAFNLWWTWHPEARMLFKRLDREAWKDTYYNPVKLLRILPRNILETAAGDADYLQDYHEVLSEFQKHQEAHACWFCHHVTGVACLPIAYFSLEYGLHRSMPFFAGGLGFLAGDYLKECSDLGVPLVAVGFMYPEGYLRQKLDRNGWQEGIDESLDRDNTPITRVLNEKGEQLVVKVPFMEPPIHVAVWRVMVGRISLILMDTDIEMNDPWTRRISDHLYVSDMERRLRQEIVLGIGGSEVLRTLGIKHSVLHLNEGHPAFALLERIRERVAGKMNYEEAVQEVRSTSVFTTHTPVPAGHDVFPFNLMDKYFSQYYPLLGLYREAFFRLGTNPDNPEAGFNMTALALRLSAFRNGVSKKHGEVSRRMWHSLWPDLPEEKVPIDHVTNGIHVPTWIEPKMALLFNKYLGPDWLREHDNPEIWEKIDEIPDQEFWQVHFWQKMKLIHRIRGRARRRWAEDHPDSINVLIGGALLEPTALTIGFARRIVTYKRADLIFHDLERLKTILSNPWRPVQIIFAGKAHPADDPAKHVLQRIFNFARTPELGGRIAFVEDYGEQLAQYLVHGVDVWLNNPLPPLEACGTSGMKASLNGVPHLSILDGWWIEGFKGKNGWAFGGEEGENRDAKDAEAIYSILENDVVPLYYQVDEYGTPSRWVKVMKEAIKSNAGFFSARRMTKEYLSKFYYEALKL